MKKEKKVKPKIKITALRKKMLKNFPGKTRMKKQQLPQDRKNKAIINQLI
jgi:hypothetical protein